MTERRKKRCLKCGAVGAYRPREQRCKNVPQVGFTHKFFCWGQLETVIKKKAVSMTRPQDVAQRKLEAVRKTLVVKQVVLAESARRIARLTKTIRQLETQAVRYAKRASMTDAEVEAERVMRITRQKAKPVKRGIRLEGDV